MTRVLPRIPRLLLVSGVLALIAALLAMACGGEADAPAETPPADSLTFDVSMGDNFFQPKEFTVRPGQTVTFNLTNNGAAIHNMHIAGPDGQYDTGDDAVSDPEMLNPGETAVLTWTAPNEPAAIDFRCDVHPLEQTGTIAVQ